MNPKYANTSMSDCLKTMDFKENVSTIDLDAIKSSEDDE